jgi:CBS domain-containing membrane protein
MTTTRAWLHSFIPTASMAGPRERMRACVGALIGLGLAGVLSYSATGGNILLIAPMGASSVLLFCLPASPLAQPWSVVGGNVVSALVGIACAHAIANPMVAAPLAGCLAIAAMFQLRCLHPPGGAVALTAVLGGPAVHAAGIGFALAPVGLNSFLLALAAVGYNNLTGRRYPHAQQSRLASADPARPGFSGADLDAALAHYGQVLDISRDDLESILFDIEMHAYARRAGVVLCSDIMEKSTVTLAPGDTLAQAWRLMRLHQSQALAVVDRAGRLVGMLEQGDVLRRAGLDGYSGLRERLRLLFAAPGQGQVGAAMTAPCDSVAADAPMNALVPVMLASRLQHVPVVDDGGVLVGMVTQARLLAAMVETRQPVSGESRPPN